LIESSTRVAVVEKLELIDIDNDVFPGEAFILGGNSIFDLSGNTGETALKMRVCQYKLNDAAQTMNVRKTLKTGRLFIIMMYLARSAVA
jgi:hypothetical protein